MKGDSKLIGMLNKILANELTAINQYFLHSRMIQDWGLKSLGDYVYQESIDEMKHADALVGRILFLQGLPNLQQLNKLLIGQDLQECFECDLKLELLSHKDLQEAIKYAEDIQDYSSRDLLQKILTSEEEHIDWLEVQLDLINSIGVQSYMQAKI